MFLRHRPRLRVLIIALTIFAALAGFVMFLSIRYRVTPVTPLDAPRGAEEVVAGPTDGSDGESAAAADSHAPENGPTEEPTPAASPSPSPSPQPSPSASPSAAAAVPGEAGKLLIPVAGVRPEQLRDTYNDARSEGRVHNAIDIEAPRGTPVLAAADGRIVKLFTSEKGGITLYQLGADEHVVYYYAHLDRYAEGLREGHYARQGEIIAYVGDTGNATPGNYHLHFQVYRITDPKRYWEGENINPYPLLTR